MGSAREGVLASRSLSQTIIRQGTDPSLVARLEDFLNRADELSIQRIRPYALADRWEVNRRAVLEMFLRATRAGILDMSWDLLCPSCRGTTEGHTNLGDVHGKSHCDTCQIDFTVNFDHNIEVVFKPNASVRAVEFDAAFCVGKSAIPAACGHVAKCCGSAFAACYGCSLNRGVIPCALQTSSARSLWLRIQMDCPNQISA